MFEKSVFITGCDSGIGLELCRQLPRRGYFVIASCKTEAGVEKVQNVFSTICSNTLNDSDRNSLKCVSNKPTFEEAGKNDNDKDHATTIQIPPGNSSNGEQTLNKVSNSCSLQFGGDFSKISNKVGISYLMDVRDDDSVSRVVDEIIKETERRNIPDLFALVNNAGIWRFSLLEESSLSSKKIKREMDTWKEVLETNLLGYLRTTLHVYPLLKRSTHKKPRIIFVSSVLDYEYFPGQSSYTISKRAVRALHELLPLEFLSQKVQFICISPGPMRDTSLVDELDHVEGDRDYLLRDTLNLKNSLRGFKKVAGTRFRAVNAIIRALDSRGPKKRYSNIPGTFLFRVLSLLPKFLKVSLLRTVSFNYWWIQDRFPLFVKILRALT